MEKTRSSELPALAYYTAREGAFKPAAESEPAFLCPEDLELGARSHGFPGLKATLVFGGTQNEGSCSKRSGRLLPAAWLPAAWLAYTLK